MTRNPAAGERAGFTGIDPAVGLGDADPDQARAGADVREVLLADHAAERIRPARGIPEQGCCRSAAG